MNFKLKARVNRSDARTIRHALEQLSAKGSVRKVDDEFLVEAEMEGARAWPSIAPALITGLEKLQVASKGRWPRYVSSRSPKNRVWVLPSNSRSCCELWELLGS